MFYSTYPCLYWEHNSKVTLESFWPCNPTPNIPSKYLTYLCRETSRRLTNQIPTLPQLTAISLKEQLTSKVARDVKIFCSLLFFFSFSILILLDSEIHMVQLLEAVTCPETKGGNPPFSSKDYYPKKNDRHFFQQTSKLSAVIINPPFFLKHRCVVH